MSTFQKMSYTFMYCTWFTSDKLDLRLKSKGQSQMHRPVGWYTDATCKNYAFQKMPLWCSVEGNPNSQCILILVRKRKCESVFVFFFPHYLLIKTATNLNYKNSITFSAMSNIHNICALGLDNFTSMSLYSSQNNW